MTSDNKDKSNEVDDSTRAPDDENQETPHTSSKSPLPKDLEDGEISDTAAKQTNDEIKTHSGPSIDSAPPLPDEAPPLPAEQPPGTQEEDDGWEPVWEASAQAFYFYNRITGATQWTNPRVPEQPENVIPPAPGTESRKEPSSLISPPPPTREALPAGGYNPAIHGDYDPNAWYAQTTAVEETPALNVQKVDPSAEYGATAAFNRFTGRFQNSEITPENFNDENKSRRQMNAFFDVDAAANSHDGRSLKAERSGKKLTKTELKNFKEKRKAKKEEKRRAWLRD